MTQRITFDTSEVEKFAADMGKYPATLQRFIRPIVVKGAVNIKNDMMTRMQQSNWFKGVAKSISFDEVVTADGYGAVIGPVKGKGEAGNLANIAYFGSSRGGGTVELPQEALEREIPAFVDALADAMEEAFPNG